MEPLEGKLLKSALNKKYLFVLFLFLSWCLVFKSELAAMASVWLQNEAFRHCFVVAPVSLYFALKIAPNAARMPARFSWGVGFPLVVFCIFLSILGYASNTLVIAQMASITLIFATVYMVLGVNYVIAFWFPLTFLFFAVPVGEEFIPALQSITANNAVWLLKLANVPIFREGMYISIPNGKFYVAEACSGVRFLIATTCFSWLYVYITYVSWRRRILFMLVAVVASILANSVRVFLTIMLGYHVDMELAASADHLIYGWVFFAIVFFSLIWGGNHWRQDKASVTVNLNALTAAHNQLQPRRDVKLRYFLRFGLALLPLIIIALWKVGINQVDAEYGAEQKYKVKQKITALNTRYKALLERTAYDVWRPTYTGFRESYFAVRDEEQCPVVVYVAAYHADEQGREMISSFHSIYDRDRWQPLAPAAAFSLQPQHTAKELTLKRVGGGERRLIHWYHLNGYAHFNEYRVKLAQAVKKSFFSVEVPTYAVLLSAPNSELCEAVLRSEARLIYDLLETEP